MLITVFGFMGWILSNRRVDIAKGYSYSYPYPVPVWSTPDIFVIDRHWDTSYWRFPWFRDVSSRKWHGGNKYPGHNPSPPSPPPPPPSSIPVPVIPTPQPSPSSGSEGFSNYPF